MRSLRDVQRLCGRQDLTAESRTQGLRSDHIDAPALQKARQFALDNDEVQTWRVPGLKLHQHVDVAVRAKIVAKRRAEDGEALDVILVAECSYCLPIDRDVQAQGLAMIR